MKKNLINKLYNLLYYYHTKTRTVTTSNGGEFQFDETKRINKITGHVTITLSNIIAK